MVRYESAAGWVMDFPEFLLDSRAATKSSWSAATPFLRTVLSPIADATADSDGSRLPQGSAP